MNYGYELIKKNRLHGVDILILPSPTCSSFSIFCCQLIFQDHIQYCNFHNFSLVCD